TRYVYQENHLPRRRAGLRAEIEPARQETVQTGAAHRPTRPTGGALEQRPYRRERPIGAPGGARVYPGGGRSDGRGLSDDRADLRDTGTETEQAGALIGVPCGPTTPPGERPCCRAWTIGAPKPARDETVETGAAQWPTGPTGGALGQRPYRRERPSGALGGAAVYPGGGCSDGRSLAGPRRS
ncbi:hypothetical protein PoB_002302700, partial [Plakobranchus ocellatus]